MIISPRVQLVNSSTMELLGLVIILALGLNTELKVDLAS